jgi:peptide/nickel transport system substrate-binding protein
MGRRRRTLDIVGLALVVALVAVACGSDKNTTKGAGNTGTALKGGTYRTAVSDFGFTNAFDPTGEYAVLAWNFYSGLTRTLVSYRHVAGAEGNRLFPDLAAAMPAVSSDGLTYTFKLKPSIQFGPPLGRAITSKDIAYAFQRINTRALVAQYGGYYHGIIKGMDGTADRPAPIPGITTPDDQTIVFHLDKPTGDFLFRLAMPATAPIPAEVATCFTKAGDYGRFVISSGPYMIQGSDKLDTSSCATMKPISGFDPSKHLRLVRNPNYDQRSDTLRGNYVDGVQVSVNSNVGDIFNKVDAGTLDGSLIDQPPKGLLRSYLADPDKKRLLHSDSGDRTFYITMNTAVPPFDDIHLRQAVNWVIDKAGILQAWGGTTFGQIATHIMPPTLVNDQLGQDYDPYASMDHRGDVAKAQAELKRSKYDANKDGKCDGAACRNLLMVNSNVAPWTDAEPVVVQSLGRIGVKVKPRQLTASAAFTTIQTVANRVPIALNGGWVKDYADPYTFAGPLFAGSSIIATGNTNYSLLGLTQSQASELKIPYPAGGTPNVDAEIGNCQKIPQTDPSRTNCWVNFDKQLMERVVPWVPYLWGNALTVTAPTVTKYEFDQFSGQISLTQIAVNNKAATG